MIKPSLISSIGIFFLLWNMWGCPSSQPPEQKDTERMVHRRLGDIKKCWQTGHDRGEKLKGKWQRLIFVLYPNGDAEVRFHDKENDKTTIATCVKKAVINWPWLAFSGLAIEHEIPISLEPHHKKIPTSKSTLTPKKTPAAPEK